MAPRKRTAQELSTVEQKRGPNPKYDYDAARLEFIEGIEQDDGSHRLPTLKELAERHDIPYSAVRRKSSNERWPDRQNTYQSQIAQERQKKRVKELANKSIEFDNNAYNAAKLGVSMATARLAEIAEEFRAKQPRVREARERLERGEPVERWELMSAVNYKELDGLSGAMERFQNVGMKALGTDVERHEISNPDGSMQQQPQVNITAELYRDDPDRLGAFIKALEQAGLSSNDIIDEEDEESGDSDNTVDAEEIPEDEGDDEQED